MLTLLQKKPTRTMANPPQKPQGRKQKVKQGEPLDPEELTRRLNAHILQQNLKAEKRREARAAKAASEVYHHVPTVAASAFERTTYQDTKRKVHKLSVPMLRAQAHREVAAAEDAHAGAGLTSLQKTQAADRKSMEREITRGRNQFQWDHELETAHEDDVERGLYEPPQRTFNPETLKLRSKEAKGKPRPLSTGNVAWDELERPQAKVKVIPPKHGCNDRTDWVQRDDDDGTTKKKGRTSPLLRKMESSWILMGKKTRTSGNRDEAVAGIADLDSPPEIKQGFNIRGSILAKFKKQPS